MQAPTCTYLIIIILAITIAIIVYMILSKVVRINTCVIGGAPRQPRVFAPVDTGVKNILIVDIANMYVGWYMEKYKKAIPQTNQCALFKNYTMCMSDHYDIFSNINDMRTCAVTYVIKNYKGYNDQKIESPRITTKAWDHLHGFVRAHNNAHVAVAEDYTTFIQSKWKSPRHHYIRGRDDYLCFVLAQTYKKQYATAFIMSDDKFDDFSTFGKIPVFTANYICNEHMKTKTCTKNDHARIKPSVNLLGQFNDYNIVKITMAFSFEDSNFGKKKGYKTRAPGSVWCL